MRRAPRRRWQWLAPNPDLASGEADSTCGTPSFNFTSATLQEVLAVYHMFLLARKAADKETAQQFKSLEGVFLRPFLHQMCQGLMEEYHHYPGRLDPADPRDTRGEQPACRPAGTTTTATFAQSWSGRSPTASCSAQENRRSSAANTKVCLLYLNPKHETCRPHPLATALKPHWPHPLANALKPRWP